MIEDFRFLRESVVDVDAAVVGVSSARWTHIEPDDASEEAARAFMERHHFDVLPIGSDPTVKEYFCTVRWSDYTSVQRKSISHRDLLPLTTPIRDLIRAFVQASRDFFFLTQERKVVGLVSIANLNCRQVTVWLFSLLAELETALAAFVTSQIAETVLLTEEFTEAAPGEPSKSGIDTGPTVSGALMRPWVSTCTYRIL